MSKHTRKSKLNREKRAAQQERIQKRKAQRRAEREESSPGPSVPREHIDKIIEEAERLEPSTPLLSILPPIFTAAILGGGLAGEDFAAHFSEGAARIAAQTLSTSLIAASIVAIAEKTLTAIRNGVIGNKLEKLIDDELSKIPPTDIETGVSEASAATHKRIPDLPPAVHQEILKKVLTLFSIKKFIYVVVAGTLLFSSAGAARALLPMLLRLFIDNPKMISGIFYALISPFLAVLGYAFPKIGEKCHVNFAPAVKPIAIGGMTFGLFADIFAKLVSPEVLIAIGAAFSGLGALGGLGVYALFTHTSATQKIKNGLSACWKQLGRCCQRGTSEEEQALHPALQPS